jgi:hypothetical protein
MCVSSPPYVLCALPISILLIRSSEWYLVRSKEHKAPHYVVFTPVTWSLLSPNTHSTLFSKTFSLHSSLSVSDWVWRPYKTTGKIMVQHILIFTFLDSKLEEERFCTKWL